MQNLSTARARDEIGRPGPHGLIDRTVRQVHRLVTRERKHFHRRRTLSLSKKRIARRLQLPKMLGPTHRCTTLLLPALAVGNSREPDDAAVNWAMPLPLRIDATHLRILDTSIPKVLSFLDAESRVQIT